MEALAPVYRRVMFVMLLNAGATSFLTPLYKCFNVIRISSVKQDTFQFVGLPKDGTESSLKLKGMQIICSTA